MKKGWKQLTEKDIPLLQARMEYHRNIKNGRLFDYETNRSTNRYELIDILIQENIVEKLKKEIIRLGGTPDLPDNSKHVVDILMKRITQP